MTSNLKESSDSQRGKGIDALWVLTLEEDAQCLTKAPTQIELCKW